MVISANCETLHAHGAKFWTNVLLISLFIHVIALYVILDGNEFEKKVYELPGNIEVTLQTQLKIQRDSQPVVKKEHKKIESKPAPIPAKTRPMHNITPVKKTSAVKVPRMVKKTTTLKPAAITPTKAIHSQTKQTAYLKPQVVTNLDNSKPYYPQAARRRGMEGEVLLNVVVGLNGEVVTIKIKRSSGFRLLDNSALQAVKGWKFLPARRGEELVIASLDVPVRFKLLNQ